MSSALFSVGEAVIIQSKTAPQLNGEDQVREVIAPGGFYVDDQGVHRYNADNEFGYLLVATSAVPFAEHFKESALRKRHQPGEYTWEGLKTVLRLPVRREDIAHG